MNLESDGGRGWLLKTEDYCILLVGGEPVAALRYRDGVKLRAVGADARTKRFCADWPNVVVVYPAQLHALLDGPPSVDQELTPWNKPQAICARCGETFESYDFPGIVCPTCIDKER